MLAKNAGTASLQSKKESGDEPTNSTSSEVVSRGQSSTLGFVPRRRYCGLEM
jgi:hypothetical protein